MTPTLIDVLIDWQEIADRYPMLRLSVLLESEKKFVEGDTNKDGVCSS